MKGFIEGYLTGLLLLVSAVFIISPIILATTLGNLWWMFGLVITVPLISAFIYWRSY